MATANKTGIKKVRVVQADIDNPLGLGANGRPDPTVFNDAVYIEALRGDLTITAETLFIENDRVSADFGPAQPIPEAGYDAVAGSYYELRRGTVNITVQTRGLGSPGAGAPFLSYDDHPLIMMWKSGGFVADEIADPADWTDTLDGNGTDNNSGVYTSGNIVGGDLIAGVVGDRLIVRNVNWVDTDDTTVHFSPSWREVDANGTIPVLDGDPIADGTVVRPMYTLVPTLEPTPTVHVRLDYDKLAVLCYGLRFTTATETFVGEYSVQTTFNFQASQIDFDKSSADVLNGTNVQGRVPRPCGKVAQAIDSYMEYSAALPNECETNDLEDYKVDVAGELCVQEYTFTVTNTFEMIKCPSNLLGLSEPFIADRDYEATIVVTSHNSSSNQNNNPLDNDFVNEVRRTYVLAFGPHTAGNGHAVVFPAGVLRQSASVRDLDGTYMTQTLVIGAEEWYGDNVAEDGTISAGSVAANKKVKIGFGR